MNSDRTHSIPRPREGSPGAFTLIELLVVIAVIAVIAGLVVGLAPLAGRRMKVSRVQADLHELASLIEDYKASVGPYPPDNPSLTNKGINPLFYELSGTVFHEGRFQTLNGTELLSTSLIKSFFGIPGFSNSSRNREDVKFSTTFDEGDYKVLTNQPTEIKLLSVATRGPVQLGVNKDLNPWYYDSSSTNRNNRESFDLWADIYIGNEIYRIGNWSSTPIRVGTR